MKKHPTIGVVGPGNMAEALLEGVLRNPEWKSDQFIVSGPHAPRREHFETKFGVKTTADNNEVAASADLLLLCVKPQIALGVVKDFASTLRTETVIVSVCAGLTVEALAEALPNETPICRAMPNTAVSVAEGATAVTRGGSVSDGQFEAVCAFFSACGLCHELNEALFDGVTGLSGSGPAYVFMIIDALADAGVKVGLPRRESQALAAQTVAGAAKLLLESGEHPGVLKDRVTSPGGTAIAGLHTLEAGGLRTTLIDAVVAASARSQELGHKKGE